MPDGQAHSQFWNDRGGPRFPQRARSVAPRRDKKEQQRRKSCLSGLATGPHVRYQRLLSVLALVATQGVQLGRVQSLRDVRDQIGRVFNADRQPDRGVENTYFLADVSRNAGVGHACGQAGKRLGAAQAHRQLEDLQRVQEFECGGLAADNVERERGARALVSLRLGLVLSRTALARRTGTTSSAPCPEL